MSKIARSLDIDNLDYEGYEDDELETAGFQKIKKVKNSDGTKPRKKKEFQKDRVRAPWKQEADANAASNT